MLTPKVIEIARPLEAVTTDTFDAVAPGRGETNSQPPKRPASTESTSTRAS